MEKIIFFGIIGVIIIYVLSYFFSHMLGYGWSMGKWLAKKQIKKEMENGKKI